MKTHLKITASILLAILIIGDAYGILRTTWNAPVSIRIGELTPRSADISLRCSPSMIVYGETTFISGQLHNATSNVEIPYQTLDLYYRSSTETSWIYFTSVSTASDGSFSYYWSSSANLAPGSYVVNATFPGNSGFDRWSSRTDLRVVIVPPPPNLVTPGSGSSPGEEIYTLTPTFSWNSVPGADEYGLYIRDMDSNVLIFDSQVRGRTITGTSYTLLPGVLHWEGHYRWNMNSHNEAGWGEFCSPYYFQTLAASTYGLTIEAAVGGTTRPPPGSYKHAEGEVVGVTALQQGECGFDHWELDSVNAGSANPYSVTMNSAHTLRAFFVTSSQRPIASFVCCLGTLNPVIGEEVWFDASQSKGASLYTWDFEGPWGPESTIFPKIPHVFRAAGTYVVNLTVTNSNGQTDTTYRTVNVKKPPVILVHGFQSLDNYDEEEIWNIMKNSLTGSGFAVFVSHYAWGSVTSEPIQRYAESLKQEIDQMRRDEGVDQVDIVAHSMGGLVARRYIESGGGEGHVRKLIMLETPNRGCIFPGVSGLIAQAFATSILVGTDPQVEVWMNRVSSAVDRIPFISDETKATLKLLKFAGYVSSNLARIIAISEYQSYVDILAGMPSVSSRILQNVHYANIIGWLGRIQKIRGILTLDGVETIDLPNWANWHASLPNRQEVIDKVKFILDDDPGPISEEEGNGELKIQSSTSISNTISQGEMVTYRIPIDNASLADFVLIWSEGTLNLTLISPNGTLIDPSYVNPSVTYYDDSQLTIQGYAIKDPVAGIWNVSVFGANVSAQGEKYAISTYLDTSTILSLELSKNLFEPNEAFSIKANLTFCNQPVTGASLNVAIQRPDNLTESIALYDDGLHEDYQANDGLYGNLFTNTSTWGTYRITATANGSLNGEQFARQEFAIARVEQYPDLSLANSDISFSDEAPIEGQIITISAVIHNIGEAAAYNASIQFYDGSQANGTLIGECNITVILGEAETASIQWNTTLGEHEISVLVSPYNAFSEMNYTNNAAVRTIGVTGHDLTALAVINAKTVAGQAYGIPIDVAVENLGDFPEDFIVTLYANATVIDTVTVASVPNGTWTILTFTWNTTGFAMGNYTVSAYVAPVLGETLTANNNYTAAVIRVAIPGDVDPCDGYVGIDDIFSIASHFSDDPLSPEWNPNLDINGDDYVGIDDIFIAASHFGQEENP